MLKSLALSVLQCAEVPRLSVLRVRAPAAFGETCCIQHTVCIESICTIQTLSAHTVYSWVGFCIPHLHCAFRTTLFLASPTYIGRVFAFCTCILHRYSVRSLLAVGEFLHSAFCILHPARLSQL